MAVSMEDVRAVLDPEEPDYDAAARLGEGAMPHLRELTRGDDPMVASKAVYLAGLIGGDDAGDIVLTAAHDEDAAIRVAAASSTSRLSAEASEAVLVDLVADGDPGVRRIAQRAVPRVPSERLRTALERAPRPGQG